MAPRTRQKPRTRDTDEMTPHEQRPDGNPDDTNVAADQSRASRAAMDVIQNQKVPGGEHPEGTAPPLERLTDEERDADWSDVT
jgi:hypothetical protein